MCNDGRAMSNKANNTLALSYDLFGGLVTEVSIPSIYESTIKGLLHYIRDAGNYEPAAFAEAVGCSRRTIENYRASRPIPDVLAWRIHGLLKAGHLKLGDAPESTTGWGQKPTPSETATRGKTQQSLGLDDTLHAKAGLGSGAASTTTREATTTTKPATTTSKGATTTTKPATTTSKGATTTTKPATTTSKGTRSKAKTSKEVDHE